MQLYVRTWVSSGFSVPVLTRISPLWILTGWPFPAGVVRLPESSPAWDLSIDTWEGSSVVHFPPGQSSEHCLPISLHWPGAAQPGVQSVGLGIIVSSRTAGSCFQPASHEWKDMVLKCKGPVCISRVPSLWAASSDVPFWPLTLANVFCCCKYYFIRTQLAQSFIVYLQLFSHN